MTIVIVIAAMVAATGAFLWHRNRVIRNPGRWPRGLSRQAQINLANGFLRKAGWTRGDNIPSLNVFVRWQRGTLWLNLIVHGEHTLGLPMLIKDCLDKTSGTGVVVGIMSYDAIPRHLRDDAERSGLFLISPEQLGDAEALVRSAVMRRGVLARAARADPAAVAVSPGATPGPAEV